MRDRFITAAEVAGLACVVAGSFALSAALGVIVIGVTLIAGARVADR